MKAWPDVQQWGFGTVRRDVARYAQTIENIA